MRWLWLGVLLVAVSSLPSGTVVAQGSYEEQMWKIAGRLACPVCEGQSIKDSDSQLASQMRQLIVDRLRLGEDPEKIIQFLVERYGEGVRMDPPKTGFGLGVWIGPVVFFAIGSVLVTLMLTRASRLKSGS